MNTQSNAMPESFGAQSVAATATSAIHPFYWSLRRELWENRSIYIAPMVVAGVFLFGFMISLTRLPHQMFELAVLDPEQKRHMFVTPYDLIAGALMATAMIVGALYCVEAFQSERRDRSILFWKSLPVSDMTTVLAKATVPIVFLQLFTFVVTFAVQWTMVLMSTAVLLGSGKSPAILWAQLSPVQMTLLLLYHLVTVHSLWHAPFYGWLLLVSAWARRMAFLWASLPVIAILALEKLLFNTSHFGSLLMNRLGGGPEAMTMPGRIPFDSTTHLTPFHFLLSPGLWIGLLLTGAFLVAAARLRRYRDPI